MVTVCPNEEELLAVASGEPPSNELESHLHECSRCIQKIAGLKLEVEALQQAFGTIEWEPTADMRSAPSISRIESDFTPPGNATDPEKIGKYLVVSRLGSGGQASVYRAVHPTLDEQVVIKLSAGALVDADSNANNRLVAEGRILCQLKHPHIGRIYDLDFFEGRPFLVMEYVLGRPLNRQILDGANLTSRQIVVLMSKLARAVELAHRLGIVHQDIKPQNIIIDENGEPRLIDFGIARLGGAWTDGRRQPMGGTLQYMSPEQARSESKQITALSDVFSLGAVLYFLITRKPPFKGENAKEILSSAANCRFDRDALENADASPRLKQITIKAMSAKPADRFATAEAMAEALESLNRAAARRRFLARAIPVLFVLLAAAGVAWLWPRTGPIPAAGQMLVTLDGRSGLDGNLPLITGEKLKIEGSVPRGMTAVVFWIGSGRRVFQMTAIQAHGPDQFDRVTSPGEARTTSLSGPAGTEFILVVAGRNLNNAEKVEALRLQLQAFFSSHPLSELPPTAAVLVDAAGARALFLDGRQRSRDPGAETADVCAGVSTPLNELVGVLKGKGYFTAGIALSHQDGPG